MVKKTKLLSGKGWRKSIVNLDEAFEDIEPGMSIFLGTGGGEPRTLVKHIMNSNASNLRDLELIQLLSFGEAVSREDNPSHLSNKFRLKTFFSGWVAGEAIIEGRADLIPCRFSRIHELIKSERIHIDAVFIQITPPNEEGYCSLGVAVDVARYAIDQAKIVIGEINPDTPFTFGDTLVHINEFHYLVEATEKPFYMDRWPVDSIHEKVAGNVVSRIEDGSCLSFLTGPLFEALGKQLVHKRHLGIHSPIFTDTLMELVRSGAVTNRKKGVFRGKSLTSYAVGTKELFQWLNRNSLVEFQGIERVSNPIHIGRNPRFVALLPARKVDLTGRIALHTGKQNVAAGPGEAMNLVNGAELSQGGITIFALTSRNLKGDSNIVLNVEGYPNLFTLRESVDMVITEYGSADLNGRTIRERAQALIEIAHPDDRAELLDQAKAAKIIYQDQIFLPESAHLYPSNIAISYLFGKDLKVRFRAIKPSDEEGMRRLFYRSSDEAVYTRYFSPIKTMPHSRMQEYVNVDYSNTLSIVGLIGEPGNGKIIAEARFVRQNNSSYADVAFIVDENHQKLGIAGYMYKTLVRLARERGIKGFKADVLASNKAMLKVFEKGGHIVNFRFEEGVYSLKIPFEDRNVGGMKSE
ncbi:MAG: GNAT family N-acetyltransferase [Desulfobacterales bacterium]|nr:GNAT family N-acetyltransferase [Desulfobacterales bacterium]